MGRSAPPFLYDPPSKYPAVSSPLNTGFNPKAATQASWASSPPKPKRNAPLINFNQHPDSYAVIPTGRKLLATMSPHTKKTVKYVRLVQLFFRILTLLGVLGLLFCVICIRNTSLHVAWIIRVAPAVSVVHILYAIYHFCRSPTARTPASSASYMFFASVLDAGLIPFYVFTAIMSQGEHNNKIYNWKTVFESSDIADKIFYTTFLDSVVTGGLHLVSLVIDLYLAIVFRKIAKLPPDMNPLEDNLTSRYQARNKGSKSEFAEKHLSQNTMESSNFARDSFTQGSPITPTRTIPFMHTRNNSSVDTPTNRPPKFECDRSSYYSAKSHRFSRVDLPSEQLRQNDQVSQPKTPTSRTATQRRGTGPSRPQSAVFYTPPTSEHSRPTSDVIPTRDPSSVSSLTDDNWQTFPSNPPSPELHPTPSSNEAAPVWFANPDLDSNLNDRSGTVRRYRGSYVPLDNPEEDEENIQNGRLSFERDLGERQLGFGPENSVDSGAHMTINPLELNPPTPRPLELESNNQYTPGGSLRRAVLSDLPNPSTTSGRSTPIKGSSTPTKARTYGDLAYDTPSPVRRNENVQNSNGPGSRSIFSGNNSKATKSGTSRWSRKSDRASAYEPLRPDYDDNDGDYNLHASPATGDSDRKGRVVSNTGIDLGMGLSAGSPGYGNYIAGLGVGRRRDVSGKVAEEGRGGVQDEHEDEVQTKSKGRRLSKNSDFKAAGWARWKGL